MVCLELFGGNWWVLVLVNEGLCFEDMGVYQDFFLVLQRGVGADT